MSADSIRHALSQVRPGAWAVGVSGGADSVALLAALREIRSSDIHLHVVHLDHQTRGQASTEDAEFVADLAAKWTIPCTVRRRDEVEPGLIDRPANTSALYRALRMELFGNVVRQHDLRGVILAHHADDQAETVLQRLLRGSGFAGVAGISAESKLAGLLILRPLLSLRRTQLREYLQSRDLTWREDASNESDAYQRNRIRKVLLDDVELHGSLVQMGEACRILRDWARSKCPQLRGEFAMRELADLPQILADESAKRWLVEQAGVPPDELAPAVVHRLIDLSRDAATPSPIDFPGGITVRRKRKIISAVAKRHS